MTEDRSPPLDQVARRAAAIAGKAVVADLRTDHALVAWARKNGRLVRVDRKPWRNPLHVPQDGDPWEVGAWYLIHYLPYRPNLLWHLPRLRGCVLAYDGAAVGCHAPVLAKAANSSDAKWSSQALQSGRRTW